MYELWKEMRPGCTLFGTRAVQLLLIIAIVLEELLSRFVE